jgi:GT2 family glycosyltransferase
VDKPHTVAVILNWNSADATLQCVTSLQESNEPRPSIIVVDNGSTDSSWEELQRHETDLTLIQSGRNLGFAGGNNIGIRAALEAKADYVWVLNPDTVIHPLCLSELLSAAGNHPEAGVLVPKILYREHSNVVWYAGGSYDSVRAQPNHWGIGAPDGADSNITCDVTFATGCSLLVSRETFERVGLLDEKYFLYWEDVEFSRRVLRTGYRICLVATARVWHHVGSNSGDPVGRSPVYDYYNMRNRLWYVRGEHHAWEKVSAYIWTGPLLLRRFARMMVRREEARKEKVGAVVRGLHDGLLKTPGEGLK